MNMERIGKCGFYCGSCPTYIAGNCNGCIDEHKTGDCYTRDCTIQRGLDFCGKCPEFPCATIMKKERCTILDKAWLHWKQIEKRKV